MIYKTRTQKTKDRATRIPLKAYFLLWYMYYIWQACFFFFLQLINS